MFSTNFKEKYSSQFENEQFNVNTEEIKSDFSDLYQNLIQPAQIDSQKIQSIFNRNDISYCPAQTYESFHFEVEAIVPNMNYYHIHVKLGHFSLIITAIKCALSSLIQHRQSIQGAYGKIYFVNLQNRLLCFKSFSYKTEISFQKTFGQVVKEWSILKICSVLQCGPYIPNEAGFNLIIYEDCIQYVMERGIPINKFTSYQMKQMKQELWLMHQLQIIHFDIKNENIVYSPHFQKPVFIDFGFSDVIKEKNGFKTLSSFKGTPNFCTREMLALILQNQNFVDLYYNDAFGLNEVFKPNKLQQFDFVLNQQENSLVIENQIPLQREIQSAFLIFNFQYHYLNRNELELRHLLRNAYLNDIKSVKQLLVFMKDVVKYIFLPHLFDEGFKSYQHLIEYQQIDQQCKFNGEIIYIKNGPNGGEEQIAQSFKLQVLQLMKGSSFQCHDYKNYLQIIMNIFKVQKENITHMLSLVFQCIRFDNRNLEFQEKVLVAKKVNPLLLAYQNQLLNSNSIYYPCSNGIEEIILLMELVFNVCLHSTPNKWIKNHIFDVFEQLILLDTDFSQHVDKLLAYLLQNYQSVYEHLFSILQCVRFVETSRMIITSYYSQIQIIETKFRLFIKSEIIKLQDKIQGSRDQQTVSIRSILNLFVQDLHMQSVHIVQEELKHAMQIRNPKVRKYLIYCIINDKIQFVFDAGNSQSVYEILHFVKSSLDLRNIDFLSYIRINMKIIKYLDNEVNSANIYHHIAYTFNCPYIFNLLSHSYKYGGNKIISTNYAELTTRIKYLIESYPHRCKIDPLAVYQLYQIFLHLPRQINSQTKALMVQLYSIYEECEKSRLRDQQIKINHYYSTLWSARLDFYFYQFIPNSQTVFLQNLTSSLRETIITKSNFDNDNFSSKPTLAKLMYFRYKYVLYQYYLSLSTERFEQCINCTKELIQLCSTLNINFLKLNFLKEAFRASVNCQKEDLLIESVLNLFYFCKQINHLSFYLQPKNEYHLLMTFLVFTRHNQCLFHELIMCLTQFLCGHTMNNYFQTFVQVIDSFLKLSPGNGYALHYKLFASCGIKIYENPYLLIFYAYSLQNQDQQTQLKLFKVISINCDRLTQLAKRTILEKYFSVFIQYLQGKKRRQIIFVFRVTKKYIAINVQRKQVKSLFKAKHHPFPTIKETILQQKLKRVRSIFQKQVLQ